MEQLTVSIVIRTLISRLLVVIIMAVAAVPAFIFMILPDRWRYDNPLYYWFVSFIYWAGLKAIFVPITYKGLENVPKDPAVIVGNHQSSLDIPLIGTLVDAHPHIWLATITLLDSPLLGFVLRRMAALIDMSSPQAGMRSLVNAMKLINNNKHAIIFPEGGRYLDGKVHPFYGGFVILAKKTGRPVVPVYIRNVQKVYPPDNFWIYWYPIEVIVGQPFHYQETDTDEEFKQKVFDWFVQQEG
jgi:1-acyl-sn-glycerol-3-phosphate acyltransferase